MLTLPRIASCRHSLSARTSIKSTGLRSSLSRSMALAMRAGWRAGTTRPFGTERERLALTGEGLVERGVLPTVQVGVVAEVGRSFGLIGDDPPHELLPAHGLERVVLRVLGADRRDGLHAEVLATR